MLVKINGNPRVNFPPGGSVRHSETLDGITPYKTNTVKPKANHLDNVIDNKCLRQDTAHGLWHA